MNKNEQLDLNLLGDYLTNLGKPTLVKMIALYEQQVALYLQNIEQAIADESQSLWQEHCHKMKGAAGSVGLTQVHLLLVTLEKSTESFATKAAELDKLKSLNKKATAEFQQWLSK
ncbi:MAG: phosphorelay protein [Gammaproteobacteria bacterium]|nr:MAG: phosphorelay protein [Gammaproteobacteria bacterium]